MKESQLRRFVLITPVVGGTSLVPSADAAAAVTAESADSASLPLATVTPACIHTALTTRKNHSLSAFNESIDGTVPIENMEQVLLGSDGPNDGDDT